MGLSREVPLPFTVSHAAAAWPIRAALGGRVVLSALVVGTLAPDAEYFVHMGPVRTISHTFPGLFLMDLPVGLALLWLFHRLYKRSFALLLPEALAARLLPEAERPFRWGPPGRFLAICASIWAGSATHVLWDAFTHRRSAVEHGWTWLTAPVFRAFGMDFAVHSVLQNLS
ncbi:MAG: DUF4184 family protein, partial [Candidatus Methylomirabilis sp.]|nr:DUF4184 family protein [Deltaproteobacteria bacterium]